MGRNKEYDELFDDMPTEEEELTDFDKIALYYKKRKIIKWSIIGALGLLLTCFIVITILALSLDDPKGNYIEQNDFDDYNPDDYFPD